jgi:hypothetical protein
MPWNEQHSPIVIGGLGGSGTRVVAQILRDAGVYIGSELNEPLDNLWFTLLFRRRSIKNPGSERLLPLLDLFAKRMHGNHRWNLQVQSLLCSCAFEFILRNYVPPRRFGFPIQTMRSFYKREEPGGFCWGWKEPNSHVFLPLLINYFQSLRYVHVIRHPRDAVFGSNKLQLRNWKHLFGITGTDEHKAMLLFHQVANQRAIDFGRELGDRFLLLKFEDLCAEPKHWTKRLIEFAGLDVDDEKLKILSRIPNAEKIKSRKPDLMQPEFMLQLQNVAEQFGYSAHEIVAR